MALSRLHNDYFAAEARRHFSKYKLRFVFCLHA